MERTSPREGCAVWGVLNVTPDSFSDGGWFLDCDRAVAHGLEMVALGADVVDVGGESSRPPGPTYGFGSTQLDAQDEVERVVPVVERLAAEGVCVSIDTVKADVAKAALAAGARIVNDVSMGRSGRLLEVVAEHDAEIVLMHTRHKGEVSGTNILYADLVAEVLQELLTAAKEATKYGVKTSAIWLDPGIGFAKTAQQSATLLGSTGTFAATGHRVLVGPSRKSFIANIAPDADGTPPAPRDRLAGTLAAVTVAVCGGAHAVRVHDVREARQAVAVALATRGHA